MTREELCNQISTILKELIGNKQDLLRLIETRLALSIPKSYTYRKIVERIIDLDMEEKFCELFQFKDFKGMIKAYRNGIILNFFSNDELRLIGQKLCEAKYDPSSRNSLIVSISRNVIEKRLIKEFIKTNREKEEGYVVQQQKRWIVGPLGLLRSSKSRGWYRTNGLIQILETFLHSSYQFTEFFTRMKEKPRFNWKDDSDDPLYRSKCIQSILALSDDDTIIDILNQLIDKTMIEIESLKMCSDLMVSPYGIFEETYNGYKNLVDLLLRTFADEPDFLDAELRSEGSTEGSLELRVREICLKKTPEEIITIFFGLGPNLIRLAKEIGLVSLAEIRNKESLLQAIILKLGFTYPPTLEGISTYSSNLRRLRGQLQRGIDEERGRGLWNKVYSDSEKIIRDLILFFFSCLWESRLREYYEDEVKARRLKEMVKREFKLAKPFDVLTLGDLCTLIALINKEIQSKESLEKTVETVFGRSYFIPQRDLRKLNSVTSARTTLTGIHPTKKRLKDPIGVISQLIEMSEEWSAVGRRSRSRIFPYMVRIKEERTNEFGISHSLAIDEEGNQWILKKSGMWIRPEYAYYILTDAKYLAIEPIMVEKFW